MRYICRMEIEFTTPLHCGGGTGESDQPVIRDSFGHYMIPGTSIAGILRHLSYEILGSRKTENLFGVESAESEQAHGSKLQTSDASLIDLNNNVALDEELKGNDAYFPLSTIVRDHVKLNPETGVGEEGGKFDEELVPPLTRFAFEIGLFAEGDEEEVKDLVHNYLTLLSILSSGEVSFGGGYSRGLGACRLLSCDCRFFDFKEENDMEAFLNLSRGLRFTENDGGRKINIPAFKKTPSARGDGFTASLEMVLNSNGPLLVGGSSSWQDDADMTCGVISVPDYEKREFSSRFILPGSSVKGAIRSRVWQICSHLGHDADTVIREMFGTEQEGGRRGKVRIQDILLPINCKTRKVQHVAIDRFTGGALDAALFNEAPIWMEHPLTFTFSCEVSGLSMLEAGLFVHAILDLAEGRLPIGGGVNRGNGRLLLKGLDIDNPEIQKRHLNDLNITIRKNQDELYSTPEDLHLLKRWSMEIDKALNVRGENHG